ncbi:MAG: alkaline phosphatase family protein [Candidatus Hermodarchaeota archaeon]
MELPLFVEQFHDPSFFAPNYNQCITQLMPSMIQLLDIPVSGDILPRTLIDRDSDYDISINLMIDSLGFKQWQDLHNRIKPDFFDLYNNLNGFALSSVFPTITSTAITSYHTGHRPIEHGILGHRINLPEVGTIVDTLRIGSSDPRGKFMPDSFYRVGINPQAWLFRPNSLYHEFEEHGGVRVEISHLGIHRTGLSHFFRTYSNQEHLYGRTTVIDAFSTAKRVIKKLITTGQKGLLNIYFAELDTASHLYGSRSNNYFREMQHILDAFQWFVQELPSKKILVSITGDHGQTSIDPNNTIKDLSTHLPHASLLYNTGRVLHCHTDEPELLYDELIALFQDKAAIVDLPTALKLLGGNEGISSLIHAKVRERIGDFQILLKSGYGVSTYDFPIDGLISTNNTKEEPFLKRELLASHGSLTLDELIVPTLIADVNELKRVLNKD